MQKSSLRLALLVLATTAFAGLAAADKKPDAAKEVDLAFEDVLFDAQYLRKFIGANTLVVPDEKTKELPTSGIIKAGLEGKTKIYALPDQAEQPKLNYSMPPTFPRSLRLTRDEPIKARFLVFVGPDGLVKCIYCYEHNREDFAIVVARSVIKWRYKPAKLNGTAVPVIMPVDMEFSESMAAVGTFRGPKIPNSNQGNPAPPPAVRPGANSAPK